MSKLNRPQNYQTLKEACLYHIHPLLLIKDSKVMNGKRYCLSIISLTQTSQAITSCHQAVIGGTRVTPLLKVAPDTMGVVPHDENWR